MKTIIAPIDFSKASTNALSFAAELCSRASARLNVINVLEDGADYNETTNKLKDVEIELKRTFGSQLDCSTLIVEGNLVTALQGAIDIQKPDLIVMGTKGASGLKRILIGSNTVNLIAKTKLPVLVIPEVAHFEDFVRNGKNRVVLATDLNELEEENSLDILKEIALVMIEPNVRIVSVRPKNTSIDFLKKMERGALIYTFKPEIEADSATVFSSDVMSGINYYLSKHSDTGLIAMIARDSGHLIQKHYSREMASHTNLPLLVLHDVKTP